MQIPINSERLATWQQQFAEFGKTAAGGITRLALSDADKSARDLFVQLTEQLGCTISIDAAGNIFARLRGSDSSLAPVLVGSHGDSQPQGGRFDGMYGVLAGLEALYSIKEQHTTTLRDIVLVMWTGEEGSRFAPSMLGSGVFTGKFALDEVLAKTDANGIIFADEAKRIGYAGNGSIADYQIHASLEIHIEQGPILETENIPIGVVNKAMGQKWYEITLTGMAAHAGTTPLDFRRDALLGFAKATTAINQIGQKHGNDARATVGKTNVQPNSSNVVASQVTFSVEFRHPSQTALEDMDNELRTSFANIAAQNNLQLNIKELFSFAPIDFNEHVLDIIRQTTAELGYQQQDIISGAGHDSCYLNEITKTAMIFIPCKDGISHNELEDITDEWATIGAHVLTNCLNKLANEN